MIFLYDMFFLVFVVGVSVEEEYKPNLLGTPLYVSYYIHQGRDVTRRDDFLENVKYDVFTQE